MVKCLFYDAFDVCEVGYHTVFVELFCLAIHCDYKVVSVQRFALAFIAQMQVVRSRYGHSFFYVVHVLFSVEG